jgi:hypothetical protein
VSGQRGSTGREAGTLRIGRFCIHPIRKTLWRSALRPCARYLSACERSTCSAHERLDERGDAELLASSKPVTPEARSAWPGTPRIVRSIVEVTAPQGPTTSSANAATSQTTPARPRWAPWAHHRALAGPDPGVAPGPHGQRAPRRSTTPITRIKRISFGFRRFAHYCM